ncbi:hypothetical protein FH972_021378 [Carpinus fangiana]|uniref:L-serine ammonia-lyase n=1 Tax=Carpinus fangiana TaxID=176857 RepID=A0A5N6KPE3_9ROSI|nr:hypothetical protein FH972_021378 [Carpinus fangiana]
MPAAKTPTLPWRETPLLESSALSRAAGCRVLLKLENLQPSGSFKSRGVGNYLLSQLAKAVQASGGDQDVPLHFYASSGGNAGLAAVHAARSLNRPCTVVVPLSTKPLMIAKLRTAGAADVVQVGASWKECDHHLRTEIVAKDPTGVYVPPFDHEDIWEGNSTLATEIYQQMPHGTRPPAAVVCSVGGGGLFSGVQIGLERVGWQDVPVLALETEGAASLAASLKANQLVTLPAITSQATSLGATRVAARAFEEAKKPNVRSVVLSDAEAAMGCWRLADDERMLVEMACGINVALCYDGKLEAVLGRKIEQHEAVVIVLCGGSNVTLEMLNTWRQEFGAIEKVLPSKDVPSTQTAPT